MTRKTRFQFGFAMAFFVLCLTFAAGKMTLKEVFAEVETPTICYLCTLATEEDPTQDCVELEDLGYTECRLKAGKCYEEGEECDI